MVELAKGANAAIVGAEIRVRFLTALPTDSTDLYTLLLDDSRSVRSDDDLIFYNNPCPKQAPIRLVDNDAVVISLSDVAPSVENILVAAALDDDVSGSFLTHGGGVVHIDIDGHPFATHALTGLSNERCVILVELYRRAGKWKVRAVSQGWADGVAGLVSTHGIHVVDQVEAVPAPSGAADTPRRNAPASTPPAAQPDPVAPSAWDGAGVEELIGAVRAGVASRRPQQRRPVRLPWTRPRPQSATITAYRNQRRAEAATLTDELRHSHSAIDSVMRTVPNPALDSTSLLGVAALSMRTNEPAWRRYLGRTTAPSAVFAPVLDALRRQASRLNHTLAVQEWLRLCLAAADLQPTFGHAEQWSVQPTGNKIVIDVAVPDRSSVQPFDKYRYVAATDRMETTNLPPKELSRLTTVLFAASALSHAHIAACATSVAGLPADVVIAVNCWEWSVDPAFGVSRRVCRSTLVTSPMQLGHMDIRNVDPVASVRAQGGDTSDYSAVTPLSSHTSAGGPAGRRVDLRTIDPWEFEGLVARLVEAMGYVVSETPRSGDGGVDLYVESNDPIVGGRVVVSVKRFSGQVGPDHVRALDSVVRQQGAIKGISSRRRTSARRRTASFRTSPCNSWTENSSGPGCRAIYKLPPDDDLVRTATDTGTRTRVTCG